MLKQFRLVIMAVALAGIAISSAHAAQVWESTFPDADVDGVVQLRSDNPHSTVMIGSSVGDTQVIRTEGLIVTESNKSGRDTSSTLGHTDSFSALYSFSWTLGATSVGEAPEYFAGFTSSASPHSTRQFIGARFIREVDGSGNNYVNLGGGWGSDGNTGSGRNFAGPVDLGTDLDGRPLYLAIGYDGTTHILTVALHDGATGAELSSASGDIREFDNLGFPSGSPEVNAELAALAVTHAGWTDFIGANDAIATDWVMDSLRYYDDATGAFNDIPVLVGLVWESTFPDGDTDGVVDIFTANINGTVMIGSSAGDTQKITTESLLVTFETNKAGRSVSPTGPVMRNDSVSALYTFGWSTLDGGSGIEYYAGFTSDQTGSGQHNTRHLLGARFTREISGGNHIVQMYGAFATVGFTNSGRNLADAPVENLGTDLVGRPLKLAIGYDATTEVLDVGLFDGLTAAEIMRSTGDIKSFAGVAEFPPASIQNELDNMSYTHVGWTDFVSATNGPDTVWDMDSLQYYNTATGAFDAIGIPTGACCQLDGTCADGLTPSECDYQWQGEGTDCGSVTCTTPTGACCDLLAGCTETTMAACAEPSNWQGPDTTCTPNDCVPEGACCMSDGSCTDGPEVTCLGVYQGNGTQCATLNPPCPAAPDGACCHSDGTCSEEPVTTCDGEWQGVGSTCSGASCPVSPLGACCELDGTCSDSVRQADCCGEWQGESSTCAGSDCASLPSPVWLSTFDTDADGVEDVYDGNPIKDMIGANTGGRQNIITASQLGQTSPHDRAGRPLPAQLGAEDSFSGVYKFKYIDFPVADPPEAGVEELAGFVATGPGGERHSTRLFMTSAWNHTATGGNYSSSFGMRWGSVGFTGTGRRFSTIDFGSSPPLGKNYLLAIGYEGASKNGFVALYSAVDGSLIEVVGGDIRTFDNLGVAPNDPALQNELDALRLTHLGWSDFIAAADSTRTWSVDAMAYFDSSDGAFAAMGLATPFIGACCDPGDGSCTDGVSPSACTGAWFAATTCASVSCPGPPCNDPFADADGDVDVDQDDFARFQACFTGTGGTMDEFNCHCFDREGDDNDIDLIDLAAFELCASGPDVAADPACDD